jgi:NADPH:quinone reductase-like Zn-dependent oxidoreductase
VSRGPEVIEVAEIDLPEPGMFEIRIKVERIKVERRDPQSSRCGPPNNGYRTSRM